MHLGNSQSVQVVLSYILLHEWGGINCHPIFIYKPLSPLYESFSLSWSFSFTWESRDQLFAVL